MEGTKRRDTRISSKSISADARAAALDFIASRDEGRITGGALFSRDATASRASAEAVMDRVRALGAPDVTITRHPSIARRGVKRSRAFRIASLAVAAALVAGISSLLTLGVIRSSATVAVRFVLAAPEASSVRLAADFNRWSPDGYDLIRDDDGTWEITVPLRKGRAYAYNFIIDGERWIADPAASSILEDGFGGSSSSLSL